MEFDHGPAISMQSDDKQSHRTHHFLKLHGSSIYRSSNPKNSSDSNSNSNSNSSDSNSSDSNSNSNSNSSECCRCLATLIDDDPVSRAFCAKLCCMNPDCVKACEECVELFYSSCTTKSYVPEFDREVCMDCNAKIGIDRKSVV